MSYIEMHMTEFWYIVGFALLALEALVLGLSTGVLLFVGLAAVLTGVLLQIELIPATWTASIASVGIGSAVITAALWRPFKRMQGSPHRPDSPTAKSDLVGRLFVLEEALQSPAGRPYQYSGVRWKLRIDPETDSREIASGTMVEITSVRVGELWVKPANED